jgi:hypothetical protein
MIGFPRIEAMAEQQVEKVYVRDAAYSMVRYANGEYGIQRDDRPVEGMRWPEDRMVECIDKFNELTNPRWKKPRR